LGGEVPSKENDPSTRKRSKKRVSPRKRHAARASAKKVPGKRKKTSSSPKTSSEGKPATGGRKANAQRWEGHLQNLIKAEGDDGGDASGGTEPQATPKSSMPVVFLGACPTKVKNLEIKNVERNKADAMVREKSFRKGAKNRRPYETKTFRLHLQRKKPLPPKRNSPSDRKNLP